jgi:hypothetical protein
MTLIHKFRAGPDDIIAALCLAQLSLAFSGFFEGFFKKDTPFVPASGEYGSLEKSRF